MVHPKPKNNVEKCQIRMNKFIGLDRKVESKGIIIQLLGNNVKTTLK